MIILLWTVSIVAQREFTVENQNQTIFDVSRVMLGQAESKIKW